jgi:hypothetical protein
MKTLTLWVSYEDAPIWCFDREAYGPCEAQDLLNNIELIDNINNWDKKFQDGFDRDYPPHSSKFNPEELKVFNEEGLRLAKELVQEIGYEYKIKYHTLSYDVPHQIIEIN